MPGKPKSLINNVYGNLIVIKDSGERYQRKAVWECLCSCGVVTKVATGSLVSGNTKSCGCMINKTVKTKSGNPAIAQTPIPVSKLQVYYNDIKACFSSISWVDYKLSNNEIAILDNSSMAAILFITPDKYNQEYLCNNKITENYAKARMYIKGLADEIIKLGYQTIVVYESEWVDKQYKILNFLTSVLKLNSTTVFARKCKVSSIDKKEAFEFLEKEHIQGPARISNHFYGLHAPDGTLIEVLTFGKHHRQQSQWNKPDIAILDRFAVKHSYNVPGGASKLLKFAEADLKSRGFTKIVSWSDNRISRGNLYFVLGFTLHEEITPDYSYYCEPESLHAGKIVTRGKQANKKSKCPNIKPNQTELEHTRDDLRHFRVYDLGKKVWYMDIA